MYVIFNNLLTMYRPTFCCTVSCFYYARVPVGWGIKRGWPSSLCPSVPCLTVSGEWKVMASWKLAGLKPIIRVTMTPFRGRKVKGQGLLGLLMHRQKMRHIFRRETDELQTCYRDEVWWPASPTRAVTSKVKITRSCHQSDACLPVTRQ